MIKFLLRLVYTFLALSLIFLVYAINKTTTINKCFRYFNWEKGAVWVENSIPNFVSYVVYFILLIGLTLLLIKTIKLLPKINLNEGNIICIEPASDGLMITYFGLFFFALSVNNALALLIIFIILIICIMLSNVYMFNPLLSIIGYKFYYITFKSGKRCLLISKERFAHGDEVKYESIYRFNDFTFID